MVQVALFLFGVEVVHHLGITGGAEGNDGHHLGQPPLEQTRPVDALWQQAHLTVDGAHLVQLAAIYPHLLVDNLLTHQLFGDRFVGVAQGFAVFGHRQLDGMIVLKRVNGGYQFGLNGVQLFVPLWFSEAKLLEHLFNGGAGLFFDEGG